MIFTCLPSLSEANSSKTGQSILQGPHRSAQKSISTTPSNSSTSFLNCSDHSKCIAHIIIILIIKGLSVKTFQRYIAETL